MYGDPDAMRRRVDQLREQALDIRSLADQLVARTEALGWSGRAADAMRVRVAERAHHLRDAAARHDCASDSLDRHMHEVLVLREQIADVERRALGRFPDELADDPADDPDDRPAGRLAAPPSGHVDRLDVDLPGLRGAPTP